MIFLVASIFCSTLILLLFRAMDRSNAITRHAILASYCISALTGIVFFRPEYRGLIDTGWFVVAAIEGLCFYVVFRLMAITAQRNGVAVAGIATKMSVVIPVSIGLLLLGETVDAYKVTGILAGFIAVVLAAGDKISVQSWWLPLLVFTATGLLDASFKLLQIFGLQAEQFPGFIVITFGFAFLTATAAHVVQAERSINHSSLLYGTLLGLANFGTVYFILKALAAPGWESSVVYPLNHFGVVASSTLAAVLVFKERPGRLARAGWVFAVLSIALLYLSSTS